MLEELRITGLGVIESATLELGPGLTVITGETGAGKTMVVTALGLLLGGRADSGAVRVGQPDRAGRGRRSGSSALPDVAAAVDDAGGEVEDDHVLLARNVSAEGRSRAFVGGASVPVSQLAAVAEPLVAVHGQSDQHRLLQPRAQRDALDALRRRARSRRCSPTTDDAPRRAAGRPSASSTEVVASARERAREADLLRFGLGEIEAVAPEPGEDVALGRGGAAAGPRRHPAHRRRVGPRGAVVRRRAAPTRWPPSAAARTLLDGVREHDPRPAALADRVAELTYLLSDLAADVASYAAGLETDPARLAAVSERRAALTALTRKYGETAADVLAWAETSAARLAELDDTDDRIDAAARAARRPARPPRPGGRGPVRGPRRGGRAALRRADRRARRCWRCRTPCSTSWCGRPPSRRRASRSATRSLRFGSSGVDEVEFLLAANTGSEPRPLAQGRVRR